MYLIYSYEYTSKIMNNRNIHAKVNVKDVISM